MITRLNLKTPTKVSICIGTRLKMLIKHEIQRKKYKSIQEFFDNVQSQIDKNEIEEKKKPQVNNPNTYNKYLNGSTEMKYFVFKEICSELGCSANYLMGLTPFNSDFGGSVLTLLNSINGVELYPWDENEPDIIGINYCGKEIFYDENELEKKIKTLIEATLFIDTKQ